MTDTPKVGRCQRCQQIRPLFRLDAPATHWSPDDYGTPTGAWLCTPHYSEARTTHDAGQPYTVEHRLEVWPWEAAKERLFIGGTEIRTQADRDLDACRAILAATEGGAL